MQNSHHKIVITLIALFTILQIIVLLVFGYTPYPDSNGYIILAKECINGQDLYPMVSKLNEYGFLWNVGAINAVVLSLKLFNSIVPLLVIYCLMKGFTALFIYQITKTISNEKIAFITLILYVLYPANYGEGTSTHSELPFIFFTLLGLWLCITKKQLFVGGMSLAFANWFRPMGIVFLLAIMIFLFINKKQIWKPLVGYIAMIIVIGSLYYLRTGLFIYQAKTGWMALSDYSTDHIPASLAIRDNSNWNVSEKDAAWKELFFEWLKEHPVDYFKQMPRKLINTYVSDNVNMCVFLPNKAEREYMYEELSMRTLFRSFPNYSAIQWLTLINLLYYYCILLTVFLSLYYLSIKKYILPLSVIILGTSILLIAGHGEARFHIPFMPFFIMLSAFFINKRICKG